MLVPKYGINAVLYGLLIAQLLIAVLHLIYLHTIIKFSFNAFQQLIRPMAAVALGVWTAQLITKSTTTLWQLSDLITLLIGCFVICMVFMLFLLLTGNFRIKDIMKEFLGKK